MTNIKTQARQSSLGFYYIIDVRLLQANKTALSWNMKHEARTSCICRIQEHFAIERLHDDTA